MIELYADGAAMGGIANAAYNESVTGFTTNPSLMRQAGVHNYEDFAHEVIQFLAEKRPGTNISLEVFADEPEEIIRQARKIDSWGKQYGYDVYVKIPVMHLDGSSTAGTIALLSAEGIKLNVTAIFTTAQIKEVVEALHESTPSIVSIFVGRITDIGYSPLIGIEAGKEYRTTYNKPLIKFLWASSRQAYNYCEANALGFDIITMTPDLIKKVNGFYNKSLSDFSLETCQMFFDDAQKSGYKL